MGPATDRRLTLTMRAVAPVGLLWLCVTLIASAGHGSGALGGLDERAWDRLQPVLAADDGIVVVAIDRESIRANGGAWPWERGRHAELVAAITEAGADGVVYDVLFADPRRGDDRLADALAAIPSAVATELVGVRAGDGGFVADARVGPVAAVAAGSIGGHANHLESTDDGVTREIPLVVVSDDGRVVPALGLTASMLDLGVAAPIVRDDAVQVGTTAFATTDGLVRLARSDDVETVSAQAVLERRIDPERLRERIVFVGVTEPTIAEEIAIGGGQPAISGTVLHAELANQLRQGFTPGPVGAGLVVPVIALLALVGTVAASRLRPLWIAVALVLAASAHLVLVTVRHDAGALVPVVWPLAALLLGGASSFALRWFVTDRDGRRVRSLFRSYVPPEVADALLAERGDATEPSEREVAVLFADLRGFTAQSATLDPVGVARWVEIFWEEMTAVVFDHDGTLISYAGDEVFAAWGAPLAVGDPGERAVRCALAMQARGDAMRRRQEAEGFPPARFGIGVHVGVAVAAHLGPPERRQYTLFGDVVNIGARLCSAAAADEVVASTQAIGGLDDVDTAMRPEQQFKGVSQKLDLRTVTQRG